MAGKPGAFRAAERHERAVLIGKRQPFPNSFSSHLASCEDPSVTAAPPSLIPLPPVPTC